MDSPSEIQKKYHANNSQYYLTVFNPSGKGELSYYQGLPVQRGSGLLTDLFAKFAVPLMTRAAPHIYKGITQVIDDVNRGKSLKMSVRRRGLKTLKRVAKSAFKGSGKRKRRRVKRKNTKRNLPKKPRRSHVLSRKKADKFHLFP